MVVAMGMGVGYHIAWTDFTVAFTDTAFVFPGVPYLAAHPKTLTPIVLLGFLSVCPVSFRARDGVDGMRI